MKLKKTIVYFFFICIFLLANGCSNASDDDQVEELKRQVKELQSQVDSLQNELEISRNDNTFTESASHEQAVQSVDDLDKNEDTSLAVDTNTNDSNAQEANTGETQVLGKSDPRYKEMYFIEIFSNKNNTTDLDKIKTLHYANDFFPLYQLDYSSRYNICQFNYADESYSPINNNDESLLISGEIAPEKFWDYVDLIFQNQVTEYEYEMDENGLIVEKTEPYIVAINYIENNRTKRMVINTPDNIEEIVNMFQRLTDALR